MFDFLGNPLLALALVLPRVIGAFLMLPLMTQQTVPAMVRNSFMVSLGIIVLPIALAGLPMDNLGTIEWPLIVLKEIFIGVAIGFCFGIVFWAVAAVGSVIDTQVGMSMAQVFDPIQGHQVTLHGEFLSQLATWLFMASGAFLVFLDLLMGSYVLWPVASYFPNLPAAGMNLFVGQFDYMMTTVLVMAAPVMVVMLVIDLSFGLVNRYAPQLNVFALTMPIKAWLATALILLLIGVYVEILLERLGSNRYLLGLLQGALG
ncbi:type III secretion system export apparatus subunit SctT [Luteimonas terricola]|uniref:EscT/YscT/HrcT family type III secretion system export apparatus protein n=1 Tax=Luteimonas terricola TaxID=645597 RepID=A0ABQ2E510_9GAMM|nr:type III secretion system export apparatus subunit SctT [Luteimonas terricola]GGJ96176.1 EscT/YscT/HrcT family type III secretion system export apparatus protein [Luteimonas terricola]